MARLRNRTAAGQALADRLQGALIADPVVLALPRGGVPVAAPIAATMAAPLDVIMVRKIGLPGQPELAAAAVVNGDEPEIVINQEVAAFGRLDEADIGRRARIELEEIRRRRHAYLGDRPAVPVTGRTAIVVDDGIATGTSVRAALQAVRRRTPARLILAVPVAPQETLSALAPEVDETICLVRPEVFRAVSLHYDDFHQVSDDEVIRLLQPGA